VPVALRDVYFHRCENTDARAGNNWAPRQAAVRGHLGVCRWLHTTFGFTGAEWKTYASPAKLPVAAWLASLE